MAWSSCGAAVNALKDEEDSEIADPVEDVAPPVRSQPTRTAPVRQAQAPATRRQQQTPAQANPSRAWVQVATGSNRAGMIFTYGQFRRRAGALPLELPDRVREVAHRFPLSAKNFFTS